MTDNKNTNLDAWNSLMTGMGTIRDKRTSYVPSANTRTTQIVEDRLYHGSSIAHRAVVLPAKEMTREGFSVQSDDLDAATRANILQAFDDLQGRKRVKKALQTARLRGDCLMFVGADDGQDPSRPLNEESIKSIKFLTLFDRWSATIEEYQEDPLAPDFGEPTLYRLGTSHIGASTLPNGALVHASRIIRFVGSECMETKVRHNAGWNDSIYVLLIKELGAYDRMWGHIESLLEDFSQGVYKIHGLVDIIANSGIEAVLARLQIMEESRSTMRAVAIDADREDFSRQATPMGGLPETIQHMNARIAGALQMPLTLLLGESAGGLGATGEGQAKQWANEVRCLQDDFLREPLRRLLQLIMLSKDGPSGGVEPDAWTVEFNSIHHETPSATAQARLATAQMDQIYIEQGVVTPSEVATSRFGGEVYSAETVIDVESREELKEIEIEELLNPPEPPPMIPGAVPGQDPEQDPIALEADDDE